jgi:chlorobactene glucosyltransferase
MVVAAVARRHAQVRLLCGCDLPPGWMGKNWACSNWRRRRAAICSSSPTRTCAGNRTHCALLVADGDAGRRPAHRLADADHVTWGERLTVPLMALTMLAYLPVQLAHATSYPLAAAANGQCMAFRRAAYATIGGHAAVRGAIVEDMCAGAAHQGGRAASAHGRRRRAGAAAACTPVRAPAIDGYTKNILAGHGNRLSLLLLSTVFHWLLFLFPGCG